MLRAGVHVAKQTLDRAGAQRISTSGFIDEQRGLMRRPCHVGHRESDERVLLDRRPIPRSRLCATSLQASNTRARAALYVPSALPYPLERFRSWPASRHGRLWREPLG